MPDHRRWRSLQLIISSIVGGCLVENIMTALKPNWTEQNAAKFTKQRIMQYVGENKR